MSTDPSEEKIEIGEAIENLQNRVISVAKRMDLLYHHRSALLERFDSIKSLNIRFRKQHTEMRCLLYDNHKGKTYEFLNDEPYELARKALLESFSRMHEARAAHGGSNQLSSDQLLEEEELMVKFEELVVNREKMITLREEFFAQEEAANVRIEKLLKVIGH